MTQRRWSSLVAGLAVVVIAAGCENNGQRGVESTTSLVIPTTPTTIAALAPAAPGANPTSNVDGGNDQLGGVGYKGRRPSAATP